MNNLVYLCGELFIENGNSKDSLKISIDYPCGDYGEHNCQSVQELNKSDIVELIAFLYLKMENQ